MHLEKLADLDKAQWVSLAEGLKLETRLFIDGDYVDAAGGGRFETVNPATGDVLATMSEGTEADIDIAVAAAKRAFRDGRWSKMAPRSRMAVMYGFADLIEQEADTLALLDTLDMGKPISDMVNIDLPACAETIRFMAECIDKIDGKVTATEANVLHCILRQPFGVVGAISPWNYPLLMAVWKIAPALAAGNTVVLKPAEQSPLSCIRLGELFVRAGGPAGVLNVVNGFGETAGRALALHNDVAKVSFTGSTEVGKLILQYAGQSNMKHVALECGGKSPQIILADVSDLERAATAAVNGIFSNQGEVCNAGSRMIVDRRIAGDFVDLFQKTARDSFSAGDPLDPGTSMGPLVTEEHRRRVLGYIEAGQKDGARLVFGGDAPQSPGAFVNPTLFADASNDMVIAREEIFGPVGTVIPVDGADEAISIANDTSYGLAAGLWTSNLDTAMRLIREIEAGVVWVNSFDEGDMTQPFGGWKQSGNARDKCFDSVVSYTQMKSAWIRHS
ncbi:aldehyde dehydrogenase family protein [Microbaculum marinum]|uniref:Aldehyde dehydrogenase family protein n=1 Tax=Microbaculum marinum TaxID=1764581 RepID=A0AAW9RA84_9HYPH